MEPVPAHIILGEKYRSDKMIKCIAPLLPVQPLPPGYPYTCAQCTWSFDNEDNLMFYHVPLKADGKPVEPIFLRMEKVILNLHYPPTQDEISGVLADIEDWSG